jgi:hypothetical protein
MQPGYQRKVLGEANTNINDRNPPIMDKYYQGDYERVMNNNIMNSSNINDVFIPASEDMDSRNEIFSKASTDPSFKDRKPLGSLQAQMPKSNPQTVIATKSKNMHTKINRGISPNQPPPHKVKTYEENENKRNYQPASVSKYSFKDTNESGKRSSSLKVKKDEEKMGYQKPSPSSRGNHRGNTGGSFVVPSNTSGLRKSDSGIKKSSKTSNSSQSIKPNYAKTNSVGLTSHVNNSTSNGGHYRLGSNYGLRNPGNSNFTANPRIRKPTNGGGAVQNTMASFRSGPVRVVNDNTNTNNNQPLTSQNKVRSVVAKKEVAKRPSSASKATKTNKIATKPTTRPGTASTRANSNRPPSPGSRSLKSDLLFSSYNKHK